MSFTPRLLLQVLQHYPAPPRFWVALSGGLDSTVLLHALVALRPDLGAPLAALHVDHGLHPASPDWAGHCRALCAALAVPLEVRSVAVDRPSSKGPEAAARAARYRAFAELLAPQERLLTAQHRDDQAETLLLQLLRGAGVRGLAAMPVRRVLGRGWLERPLLGFDRSELTQYAEDRGLRWIEDPSNRSPDLDRNYLRHEILPLLRRRWPGAARTLARSAGHCGRAVEAIDALAEQDLAHCRAQAGYRLEIPALVELPHARQTEVLRAWIRANGHAAPDQDAIERVLTDVVPARPDAAPRITWCDAELRRFRDQLWLLPPLPKHDPTQTVPWRDPRRLALPSGLGELRLLADEHHPLSAACRDGRVTVRFRTGGRRCRPAAGARAKTLKNLFQEQAVPSWLRDRVPLVFLDEALIAVADYSICAGHDLDNHDFSLFWSLSTPWR